MQIAYFSDVLCVWAYIAQLRLDALAHTFGDQVRIERRFCSVFGDTARKIATQWGAKGGYEGFNAHLRHAVAQFPELSLNADIWRTVRPASSWGPHLFLKAAQLAEAAGDWPANGAEDAIEAMRRAFFVDGRDIGAGDVQRDVARGLGHPLEPVRARIEDGAAFAALADDMHDANAMGIAGSPSFVLNDGRQKLYGNVGFRIIEANIQELLRDPHPDNASWC